MPLGQPSSRRFRFQSALAIAVVLLLSLTPAEPYPTNGVELTVTEGPAPGEITLDWRGGQPIFEVFRGPDASTLSDPGNKLGDTVDRTWLDVPPAGPLSFFLIVSPCVIDPPERCDGIDNDCDGTVDGPGSESSCALTNAASICSAGNCEIDRCYTGYEDCDLVPTTGCEIDLWSDIDNCLSCGAVCALPNATPQCRTQGCTVNLCDAGFDDCDMVDANGCETDIGNSLADCGSCGNACTGGSNAIPFCSMGSCGQTCDEGFFDVNGNPADGCECQVQPGPDLPDPAFVDSDCDGLDGEITGGIFVAGWGDDADPGTISLPKETIQAGIDAAVAQAMRDVYVSVGTYFEEPVLAPGVGVYGGYSSDFSVHDWNVYDSAIVADSYDPAAPGAVSAIGISGGAAGSTVLDGMTIFGFDRFDLGATTYAVYLRDSDQTVRISNNLIFGGFAGDGVTGAGGFDGPDGGDGTPGLDALDLSVAYGVIDHDCTPLNHALGGPGGFGTCGPTNVDGGDGGESGCADFDGSVMSPPLSSEVGQDGNGAGAGSGGGAGWDVFHQQFSCAGYQTFGPVNGGEGAAGTAGNHGAPGDACPNPDGSVVGGLWSGGFATAGGAGVHGSGGGGGGAGGGAYTHAACTSPGYEYDNLGGSGGGGGGGGCAATGAESGSSGGGSFAIFVTFSAPPATVPEILGNFINTGFGGNGGDGGSGGAGGGGGFGGNGGAGGPLDADPVDPVYPAFPGGRGGDGGDGGAGGGGGGGCGGPAYGIFAFNTGGANLTPWILDNTIETNGSGGSGGIGGFSIGNPGGNGSNGPNSATNF